MKLLSNYKFIVVVVFVVLGGGIFYLSQHQPSTVPQPPSSVTSLTNSQSGQVSQPTQAANPQMANQIKSELDTIYAKTPVFNSYDPNSPTYYPTNIVLNNVTVTPQSGGYDVHVDLEGSGSADSLPNENAIVYKTLYDPNTLNISNLSVTIFYQGQDKYGNQAWLPQVTTSLAQSDAQKVNWQVPNLWFVLSGLLNCTGTDCPESAPGPAVN